MVETTSATSPPRRASTPAGRSTALVPNSRTRRVRVPEVVVGVLLVAGCALAAVIWQRHADRTDAFVVAARSITRGTIITTDDVRTGRFGGDTDALISTHLANAVVGRVAAVDIVAGDPITYSVLSDEAPLGTDEALTSIALERGDMPPDLAPGDHVRVIVTDTADPPAPQAVQLLDGEVEVWAVDATDSATVVTLRVRLAQSVEIAAATSVRLSRVAGS